ncbi:MAG TPA: YdcH family protein, partial [Xanthobacteraceae bacterium]|nr:YdcH family protein [Xanthobacteraceae bacterium]
ESERTHPSSDSLRLAELKRRKLVLKEEIERIRAGATVH